MATAVEKIETGIPGLDTILDGGLPKNRITLLAGTAGSAKTVLATQFLVRGVELGERGVFVSFEDPPAEIANNMVSFGWDLDEMAADGSIRWVDGTPSLDDPGTVVGMFDLSALRERIVHAVDEIGATRLVLDSLDAMFTDWEDAALVRRELRRLGRDIREMGVTAICTVEREEEYGPLSRHQVEEFVTANVVVLRNVLTDGIAQRTIQVRKLRGTSHRQGEFPFAVESGEGVVVLPVGNFDLTQHSDETRVPSGNEDLDALCGGGYFRDSVALVSGATGTGKTLSVTEFMKGGVERGDRCMLFAFEESREQLVRNSRGWGADLSVMEDTGLLKIMCRYPEADGIENHLVAIRRALDEFKPNRVALDSLSAIERVSNPRAYRAFVINLTSVLKERQITGLFTSTTPSLSGGDSVTLAHISTLTDTIILLRYVELYGEIKRGIAVLKMRGSAHDRDIHELTIASNGMNIGEPFRSVAGILSGQPSYVPAREADRLAALFDDDPAPNDF